VYLISGEGTTSGDRHLQRSGGEHSDWERHLALATVRLVGAYRLLEQIPTSQIAPSRMALFGIAFKSVCQSVVAFDELTHIVWPDAPESAGSSHLQCEWGDSQ
jgi:hypothetical protein